MVAVLPGSPVYPGGAGITPGVGNPGVRGPGFSSGPRARQEGEAEPGAEPSLIRNEC